MFFRINQLKPAGHVRVAERAPEHWVAVVNRADNV